MTDPPDFLRDLSMYGPDLSPSLRVPCLLCLPGLKPLVFPFSLYLADRVLLLRVQPLSPSAFLLRDSKGFKNRLCMYCTIYSNQELFNNDDIFFIYFGVINRKLFFLVLLFVNLILLFIIGGDEDLDTWLS